MTMSIARLSAQSGLKYLFKTTLMDDLTVTPANTTTYYMKAGTPQGRWFGQGLPGINRTPEDKVTETDAKAISTTLPTQSPVLPWAVRTANPQSSKTAKENRKRATPLSAST